MLLATGPSDPGLGGKRGGGTVGWRARLAVLFPQAIAPGPGPGPGPGPLPGYRPQRRTVYISLQIVAVCLGAGVLLLRYAGIPAWDGTYAEDKGVFLDDALIRPWHLLVPYSGYLQFGPRVIGQL